MADKVTIVIAIISIFVCLKAFKIYHKKQNKDAIVWVLVALLWTAIALYKSL